MKIDIKIDIKAGVCGGVRRAIRMIEEKLNNKQEKPIYVNGELLHNRLEMERLTLKNLHIEENVSKIKDSILFFRTHGIGKDIKKIALKNNNYIIDATCPKVLNSHKIIEKYFNQNYQIVIVGKYKHPEVQGLLGQCNYEGICIMHEEDIKKINLNRKTLLIAQTTVASDIFTHFNQILKEKIEDLTISDTICSFVENREYELIEYAKKYNIVIFIGGRNSSNTKIMFDKFSQFNKRSYLIENPEEIRADWFKENDIVGISGSASTPMWQLEQVKNTIFEGTKNL